MKLDGGLHIRQGLFVGTALADYNTFDAERVGYVAIGERGLGAAREGSNLCMGLWASGDSDTVI